MTANNKEAKYKKEAEKLISDLKQRADKLNISNEEWSVKCGIVSRSTISRIVNGEFLPRLDVYLAMKNVIENLE